jgi:hypothetical protein
MLRNDRTFLAGLRTGQRIFHEKSMNRDGIELLTHTPLIRWRS